LANEKEFSSGARNNGSIQSCSGAQSIAACAGAAAFAAVAISVPPIDCLVVGRLVVKKARLKSVN
jgi:hypothetical protein